MKSPKKLEPNAGILLGFPLRVEKDAATCLTNRAPRWVL